MASRGRRGPEADPRGVGRIGGIPDQAFPHPAPEADISSGRKARVNASVVAELRMRIGTAALGREIEHAPHRPDRIDVAGVLAGFPGPEHQLGGVSVTDRTVRRPNKGGR